MLDDIITSEYRVSYNETRHFAESEVSIKNIIKRKLAADLSIVLIAKFDILSEKVANYCVYEPDTIYKMQFAAISVERYKKLLDAEQKLKRLGQLLEKYEIN